ncbi:MAG: hypothetical protein L6Q54_09895 [Leptospiraceae bacterium]|nr:hypothetical protein [Leptospiraceae bacterium]MCK6381538.1 hypothetical protein [Leptospiraceae bacterium]NUM41060.1 hypothetical protein [Leptospiraceae bacterium]
MQKVEVNPNLPPLLAAEEFQSVYGFVLDNFSQGLLKEIQSKSNPKNAQNGTLYRINTISTEGTRNSVENLITAITKLAKLRLVLSVFEIKFEQIDSVVSIQSYFIARTESSSSSDEIFQILIEKSAKAFENYLASPLISEKDIRKEITSSLNHENEEKGKVNELDILLQNYNFEVPPKSEILDEMKEGIQTVIHANQKILYFPNLGFYYIPKEKISEYFQFCLIKFESNVIPLAKKNNLDLSGLIENIEKEESAYEEDPINSLTYTFKKKIAEKIRDFHKGSKKYYGYLVVELVIYFSEIVQSGIDHKKKLQVDASANTYFNRLLDMRSDLETRFLKINLERDDNFDYSVLTALRKNLEVLCAEWNDVEGKVSVFVWDNIENLKSLNRLIYQRPYTKKDSTILHFKQIIESNEKRIKKIFSDYEFVSIYGKNLQKVYLSYIPWYYWIFFMLNVKPVIDSGYAIAKSKIKYEQMDREFKYEKRAKERNRERKEKHKKQIELDRMNKNFDFLVAAMDENYFTLNRIPILSEIMESSLSLDIDMVLNLIRQKQMVVIHSESSKDNEKNQVLNSVILYPNIVEYSEKNRKIISLAEKIQKKGDNDSDFDLNEKQTQRAKLILLKIPSLHIS